MNFIEGEGEEEDETYRLLTCVASLQVKIRNANGGMALVEEIELDRSGGVPVGEEDFNVEEDDFKEEGGAVEEDEDSNGPFTKWKETDSMTCSSEWTKWNNRQRVRPMMRRRD